MNAALLKWRGRRLIGDGGRQRRREPRHRGDEGFTLTELLIASTLLVVLLTVVMLSMSLVSSISANITSQYQEFDQALPALAPLQTLIRAEVEPGPATLNGAPTPGFGVDTPGTPPTPDSISGIGNYSLTFYSDIGTAYNNVTSSAGVATTAGPAKIVAEELTSSGTPVNPTASTTQCSSSQPCSFQVRQYLPTQTNFNGTLTSTCPFTDVAGSPACQYGSNYTLITNAQDVVNDPAAGEPIFTYSIFDSVNNITFTPSASEIQSGTIDLVSHGYPSGTPNVSLTSCLAPNGTYPTCPADAIQSLGIDLRVAAKGAGAQTVENDTVVYRYPEPAPGSPFPYQFSTTTG